MKRQDGRPEETGGALWLRMAYEVLKGSALAGAVAILALLLCALLVSTGVLSVTSISNAVLAACFLGALAGGIYAARHVRGQVLLSCFGVGAALFLLLLTSGMIVYGQSSIENGGAGIFCACLCGGTLPGLLARRTKKKRRR